MDKRRPSRHDQSSPSSTSSPTIPGNAIKAEAVKRKPVPSSAAQVPRKPSSSVSSSVTGQGSILDDYNKHQPVLQDSPTLISNTAYPRNSIGRDLDPRRQHSQSSIQVLNGYNGTHPPQINHPSRPHRTRQTSESYLYDPSKIKRVPVSEGLQRSMSLHPSGRTLNDNDDPGDPAVITKTPRSPGPNKLTSFFGWKTSSPIAEVSPASHSDKSLSPAPSPLAPSPKALPVKNMPHAIDVPKANANMGTTYVADTGFPVPPAHVAESSQIEDLEDELREISSELAGSIMREMELEDLVERLQQETQQVPELGRRTSDYFSDSGSGSVRYPLSDAGMGKAEDLAKQKRSSDQEKAQFKLGLSQKLQDERDRRKVLEAHVRQLGEQVQNIDEERAISSGVANRVRDLEASLEDHRRRLQEERRVKENFEEILDALKGEIAQYRDERDNLRDEVVPQLQARVDGLENSSADLQKLTYENTRMQQELQSLRNENTTLMNARRMQLEMQQNSSRFNAIAEEEGQSPTSGLGLGRSPSIARAGGLGRSTSIKRSNSISKNSESRESLAERIKDTEMQRDALHQALKALLERQSFQTKNFEKNVRLLEAERDRALQEQSPRKAGYEKEVTGLRYEINHLRRRADDAINQKYQCEKGLGGLKKDLDRAEQETSSLRMLLQEHDILVPERPESRSKDADSDSHPTSASLEKAYRDLQITQAMSITKLRELHGAAPSSADDAETAATMNKLLQSMADAEVERDFAQKQAAVFRAEVESLRESDSYHAGENTGLADQLRASANRVETLSGQVRVQLGSNRGLRQKLAEAVERGERDQKNSTTRINSMQSKLKELEDRLMVAQQHSEENFAQHEEEVTSIKESHNAQLSRLKANLRTSTRFSSPRSSAPISPIFTSRSPRLDKTTSGTAMTLDGALRTQFLERKVIELEKALNEADKEMEEVVGRMNMAQIEVMELQSARDDAIRQTRKLQAELHAETEKVNALMKR